MSDNYLNQCDLIVDQVVEWIGLKWTKSMIKAELRDWFGDQLSSSLCSRIISHARWKIKELYKIDPAEFKGSSIEFYRSVIRNPKISVQFKLTAQERLDKLLGLENMSFDDPGLYAEKVAKAMEAMDGTVDEKIFKDTPEVTRADLFDEDDNEELASAVSEAGLKIPDKK
jgi:hypothetical protein